MILLSDTTFIVIYNVVKIVSISILPQSSPYINLAMVILSVFQLLLFYFIVPTLTHYFFKLVDI